MTSLMVKTQNPASITILRSSRGAFCGKTLTVSDAAEGYEEERPQPGLLWRPAAIEVHDLAHLRAALMTADRAGATVIRGALCRELTPEEERDGIFRRMVDGGYDNGLWKPQARSWVALDLDGVEDHDGAWASLQARLPAPFTGAAFVWNLTASHTFKPGTRCRLFFLLSDPVEDGSLKSWASTAPPWMHLDSSLFNAVQIHYVCTPKFNGLKDPVAERWGLHPGTPLVDASTLTALRPRELDSHALGFVVPPGREANAQEIERRLATIRTQVTTNSRHSHMAGVACELVGLGMPPELIEVELDALFQRAGREPTPGESWRLIKHALGKLVENRLVLDHPPVSAVLDAADAQPPSEAPVVDGVEIAAAVVASPGPAGPLYGPNDMLNAGLYLGQFYPAGGFLRWAEQDWEWTGTCWRRLENEEVLVQRIQKQTDLRHSRANLTSKSVRSLVSRERLQQPCNLDGTQLGRVVVFRNGVLDLDSWLLDPGTPLLPHDCNRFVTTALPYDYVPGATCPRFLAFIESIWPTQMDQRIEYQKMLGYLLMNENPEQKLFILLGAPRSGKGTTLRLIRSLIGGDNCCAPNLTSLANDFGLDSLLGKSVALVGEMNSQGNIPDVAIDRLKSISGGDMVPVNRKSKGELHVTLPVRFVINCNRLPGFLDPSGALASRIVLFTMWESYVNREDTTLDLKLAGELPGIAQFALAGLRRLLIDDGRFLAPESGRRVAEDHRIMQSPTRAFLELCLEPGSPMESINVDALYAAYVTWARENGHHACAKAKMSQELNYRWPAAAETSRTVRTAVDGVTTRFRTGFALTEEGALLVKAGKLPNEA